MPQSRFQHVTTWVFDLDNTLYPPSMRLFDQIERKMNDWVMARLQVSHEEADRLRAGYWADFGTTLAGLMHHHGIDPDAYLADVHDIDLSVLQPDPALAAAIAALPGRRIIFTNADTSYAGRVLQARGLSGLFDAVYGVETAGFHPKPGREAYERIFGLDGLEPSRAAMFEDDPRNLVVPHQMGLRTVLVAPPEHHAAQPHVDFATDDLTDFLRRLA